MADSYEVLNPWADADPVPLRGISPRPENLSGKTIGLFSGYKLASKPILAEVEKGLKEKFPNIKISRYRCNEHIDVAEYKNKAEFDDWLNGVDAVISAVGD